MRILGLMVAAALILPASASAATLYDQLDNPSSASPPDESTEGTYYGTANDSQAADDFTVPAGQTWQVTGIETLANTANATYNWRIFIYADAGDRPGAQVFFGQAPSTGAGYDYTFNLSGVPTLQSGHYWVSVVLMNLYSWQWKNRTVQSGSPALWQNPGGGDNPSCTTWTLRTTCFPGTAGAPDQVFRVLGDAAPVSATPAKKCKKKKKKKSGAELAKKKCKKKKK